MITLHLTGKLATLFGSELTFDAKTPREVVLALSYQNAEYKEHLRANDWHIMVGKDNAISEYELDMQLGSMTDVYLTPRIEGANNGVGTFIVGAILFVVGAVLSYGSFGILSPLGVPMMWMGAGFMVGGIIQMTTKVPGAQDMSRDSKDDQASFLFGGPTNTASQGVAIPRGYGRMLTGSIVVSASLYAEAIPVETVAEEKARIVSSTIGWVRT